MSCDESLVATDKYEAEDGLSNHRTDYLANIGVSATNDWLANHPTSYEAYPPHGASRAIGNAYVKIASERLAETFKIIKENDDMVRSCQMLPKI
jgi:hypothetical protein